MAKNCMQANANLSAFHAFARYNWYNASVLLFYLISQFGTGGRLNRSLFYNLKLLSGNNKIIAILLVAHTF